MCSENNIPFCFIAHLLEKLTNFNENPDNIAHEMKVYNSKYNLSFDQKYSLLAAMLTGRQKKKRCYMYIFIYHMCYYNEIFR